MTTEVTGTCHSGTLYVHCPSCLCYSLFWNVP